MVANYLYITVAIGSLCLILKKQQHRNQNNDDQRWTNQIIKSGSKTFYFASQLYPQKIRNDIYYLYSFCRFTDDMIDEYSDDQQQNHIDFIKDFVSTRLINNIGLIDSKIKSNVIIFDYFFVSHPIFFTKIKK